MRKISYLSPYKRPVTHPLLYYVPLRFEGFRNVSGVFFGDGLVWTGVDPSVETEKMGTVCGWLLKAVQQQG